MQNKLQSTDFKYYYCIDAGTPLYTHALYIYSILYILCICNKAHAYCTDCVYVVVGFAIYEWPLWLVTRTVNRKTIIYDIDDGDDDYEYTTLPWGDTCDTAAFKRCVPIYIII